MNREQQKLFFAKLNANGFPVKHEALTPLEKEQAVADGLDASHHHTVNISEAQVLKSLKSGGKSSEELLDDITKTKLDDRLHFDVSTSVPLVKLERIGKIKFVNGNWHSV